MICYLGMTCRRIWAAAPYLDFCVLLIRMVWNGTPRDSKPTHSHSTNSMTSRTLSSTIPPPPPQYSAPAHKVSRMPSTQYAAPPPYSPATGKQYATTDSKKTTRWNPFSRKQTAAPPNPRGLEAEMLDPEDRAWS